MFGGETFETGVARVRRTRAFVMVLLVVAAGLALLLGAGGLYGVATYTVVQRRREVVDAIAEDPTSPSARRRYSRHASPRG